MKSIFTAIAIASLSSAAYGFGTGQVVIGTRSADFQAAPTTKALSLTEVAASGYIDPFWHTPEVTVGATLAFDQMRGNFGDALTDLSGFSFGPEILARHKFGPVTPFATLGYRLGRYVGRGTPNWDTGERTGYFLSRYNYGADTNVAQTKNFATSGMHMSAGASWQAMEKVSLVAELDLGFEKMQSDARVLSGADEYNRRDTDFSSRSLLLGGQMSL